MSKKSHGWLAGWFFVVCIVLFALALGLMLRFGGRSFVIDGLNWIRGMGFWAPVVFILVEIVVVILVLPGLPLTLGAGFIFGPVWGTLYVVTGLTAGGVLAFLIARNFFSRRAADFLLKRPRLRNLDERLSEGGWKTVMLTRMVPFFPFKLSNYVFGVMGFSAADVAIGTFLGAIPIAATNVYAGSLAKDLATMESAAARGPMGWILLGIGLVALLLLVLWLARTAQKRLHLNEENGE